MCKKMSFLILLTIILILNSCGIIMKPYQKEIYEEIQPNETAFVIPLEGASMTKQGKFDSEAFLDSMKVGAKRIKIPTRWYQKGRYWTNGKWIPTHMLIKVDRAPITREWTKEKERGSTSHDDAFRIESKESIEWLQGVTTSASIAEKDAAKFLYNYSGKTLEYILDNNVRSFAQDFLTGAFAQLFLDSARQSKKTIFDGLKIACKAKFLKKGITIENIGAAGGFNYVDEDIQNSINKKFAAEQNLKASKDDRAAAQEFAKAEVAARKKMQVEIMLMEAQAKLNFSLAALKWNGQYPNKIMPYGMVNFSQWHSEPAEVPRRPRKTKKKK